MIQIAVTPSALGFLKVHELEEIVYDDKDESNMWKKRGDPILHIGFFAFPFLELTFALELRKWADSLLIAPLDANTLVSIT